MRFQLVSKLGLIISSTVFAKEQYLYSDAETGKFNVEYRLGKITRRYNLPTLQLGTIAALLL